MDLERWQTIRTVVEEILDLPSDKRDAYVIERCAGDPGLEREVRAFLAVEDATPQSPVTIVGSALPEPGDVINGYTILELAGEGGMGTVYRATDGKIDVAIKLLRRSRSTRELDLTARLSHPNIATLFGHGTSPFGSHLVLEFIDGTDIVTYCSKRSLDLESRLSLFCDVCRAVGAAHVQLVAHRDIKPSNILVDHDGRAKLLDFGISRALDPREDAKTKTGDRAFTPSCASPEQITGEPTDARTDIYSLGVLLSLMLTEKLPYRFDNSAEIPTAILHGETVPLSALADGDAVIRRSELRGDIDAIVAKCLRKEVDSRYGTVRELEEDVRAFLQHLPVQARQGLAWYRAKKFIKRNRSSVAATTIFFLVIIGLGVSLARQMKETRLQRDSAVLEAKRYRAVSSFLQEIFEVPDPWKAPQGDVSAADLLRVSAHRLEFSRLEDPVVRATLERTLGETLRGLGDSSASVRFLESSRQIFESAGQALEVHVARMQIALSLSADGKYDEAGPILESVVSDLVETFPGSKSERGRALQALADIKQVTGAYDEALRLFHESRLLFEETGDHQLEVLYAQQGAGGVLHAMGRYEESEARLSNALDGLSKLLGPNHPSIAEVFSNRADLFVSMGRLDEAARDARHAIEKSRGAYGDVHPGVATELENLGSVLIQAEDFEGALAAHSEALSMREATLPSDHPQIATSHFFIASVYQGMGDLETAEDRMRRATDLLRVAYAHNHPWVSSALNNLGLVLANQGRLPEAIEAYEEALEIRKTSYGDEHMVVAVTSGNLANALWDSGNREQGIELARKAAEIAEASLGTANRNVAVAYGNVGFMQLEAKDYQGAQETLSRALSVVHSGQHEESSTHATILTNVGRLDMELGKLPSAQAKLEEALEILKRIGLEEHFQNHVTGGLLGLNLAKQGICGGAKELMTDAYEGIRVTTGEDSLRTQAMRARMDELGDLCGAQAS